MPSKTLNQILDEALDQTRRILETEDKKQVQLWLELLMYNELEQLPALISKDKSICLSIVG